MAVTIINAVADVHGSATGAPATASATPSGLSPGYILIALVSGYQASSVALSGTGWTQIGGSATTTDGTVTATSSVFYRFVATGDPTTYTATAVNATTGGVDVLLLMAAAMNVASVAAAAVQPGTATPVISALQGETIVSVAGAASGGTAPSGYSYYPQTGTATTTLASQSTVDFGNGTSAAANKALGIIFSETITGSGTIGVAGTFGSPYSTLDAILRLIPTNTAPGTPTPVVPGPSARVDHSVAQTFIWQHNGVTASSPQTQYALDVVDSTAGTTRWWNGNAFVGTETFVTTTVNSATIPGGLIPNGHSLTWQVRTADTNGIGPYTAATSYTSSAAPVTTVTAPTGTVGSAAPSVTWTNVLASGSSQTNYRIAVYPQAVTQAAGFVPGQASGLAYDSGTVASTSTSAAVNLTSNGTYVAYVLVTATGNQPANGWASTTFTVALTVPNSPAISAVYNVVAQTYTITLTSQDSAGTWGASETVALYRNGTLIRNGSSAITTGGSVALTDGEFPYGIPFTYTAVIIGTISGVARTSAQATLAETALAPGYVLRDPTNLGTYAMVNAKPSVKTHWDEESETFAPLGAPYPIVVADSILGTDGEFVAITITASDFAALQSFLRLQRPLLLQSPMGDQTYIRVMGTRSVEMSVSAPSSPYRETTFQYIQVAAP